MFQKTKMKFKPLTTGQKNVLTISIMGLLILIVVLCFKVIILTMGDTMRTAELGYAIEKHVKENNLTMPFPNYYYTVKDNQLYIDSVNDLFGQDLDKFKTSLRQNYVYENKTYDCKYWSYVWTNYWKYNRLKHNWKLEYIDTQNHVFVMLYNESGYIMLDLDNVYCTQGMNC